MFALAYSHFNCKEAFGEKKQLEFRLFCEKKYLKFDNFVCNSSI